MLSEEEAKQTVSELAIKSLIELYGDTNEGSDVLSKAQHFVDRLRSGEILSIGLSNVGLSKEAGGGKEVEVELSVIAQIKEEDNE